jgi:hypothetical protein
MADNVLTPEFFSQIAKEEEQEKSLQVKASLTTGAQVNPDLAARALPLAKQRGLPLDAAIQNIERFEREKDFTPDYFSSLATRYPTFSSFLADPDNAKLAHDDVGVLTSIFDNVRSFAGGPVEVAGGATRGAGALLEAGDVAADRYVNPLVAPGLFLLSQLGGAAAPDIQQAGADVQEFGRQTVQPPQERQGIATDISGGVGQVAAYIASTLLGGAGPLVLGAGQGAGIQAERADDAGAGPGQKAAAVALGAVVTAATERVQLGVLMKGIPGMSKLLSKLPPAIQNKWLNRLIDVGAAGGTEAVQETVEGFLQDTVEHFAYNPDVEFFNEWEREAIAAGGAGAIARALVATVTGRRNGTKGGTETQQSVEAVNKAVAASKLRQRSPEKFREAIAGEIGEQSVYINAEGAQTFYQSLDPENQARINAAMPDLKEKIDTAAETGADLILDRADYMAYIAGTPEGMTLAEFTKLSPSDLSAFDEKQLTEQLNDVSNDDDVALAAGDVDEIARLERRLSDMLLATEEHGNADIARTQAQIVNLKALVGRARGNPAQEARLLQLFDGLTIQRAGRLQRVPRDGLDDFINQARKRREAVNKKAAAPVETDLLGDAKKKRGKAAPTPVISWLGGLGGVDPEGPIAAELRAMDITPKTHKRLFKKGSRLRFDALPVTEMRDAFSGNIEPVDGGNGYVDPDWLLEQIRAESFGEGALTPQQQEAAERDRQMDELEGLLDAAGLDVEKATNAEIKAAIEGAGGESGTTLYQAETGGLRSALVDAAANLKQEKGSGEQMLAALRNTAGVKEEEVAWTGLDEFLKGKKTVTKAEIAEYLAENEVRVEEVVLGGGKRSVVEVGQNMFVVLDSNGDVLSSGHESRQEAELAAERYAPETKFGSYTLSGGENYREVLLTLPERTSSIAPLTWKQSASGKWAWFDTEGKQVSGAFPDESDAESARPSVTPTASLDQNNFKSSHFDQPNILAHVRLNDRVDADGKRVLFVEEIQSDWHQAGRKKGYKGNDAPPTDAEVKSFFGLRDGVDVGEYRQEMMEHPDFKSKRVPDAPLKKTWHEMAFRRVVQMAAQQGYDRVAWTTGEIQNDRFDLSHQVQELNIFNNGKGGWDVSARTKDDNRLKDIATGISADKLADYVGKDLAKRATEEQTEKGWKTYSGLDLKVGGEGMKGFYDKIIPTYAKKFAKKLGGAVGITHIPTDKGGVKDIASGQRLIDVEGLDKSDVFEAVHSLDITPEMRDTANPAYTLFQGGGVKGQFETFSDGTSVITAFQGSNLSTVLHEMGHFYSYVLRDMATQFPDSHWSSEWAAVSGWWKENAKPLLKEARNNRYYRVEKEQASGRYIVRGPYGKQIGTFKTRREANSEADARHVNLTVELTGMTDADVQRVIEKGAVTEAEGALHIVMEEQFARGFEAYLMEGKAPSLELKRAFRSFKAWLLGIYRDVKNLNVTLSPEIRGVFDRLLATDEQIEAMRQLQAFQPDPATAGVLNEAERKRYIKQSEEAVEWAKERLLRDLLKEERRKQTAEYKAERAKLLEENLTLLRESAAYMAQAAVEQGNDPATIADLHGFTSANEMQKVLAELEPLEAKAERMTDEEMDTRYGNALKDGTIERDAVDRLMEAEAGFDKSQAELRAASQKAGLAETSKDALKALAEKMHDGTTVRDATQSTRYMRATVKAARMYGAAAKAGKWEDAAKWKRQQILNQRLYALSREASGFIDKSLNRWGRLTRKSDKDAGRVIDPEFLNAIRAILSKYGISRGRALDTDKWLANIATADPDLYDQLSQMVDVYGQQAKPYKSLTMDEFRDLAAAVDNIIGVEKRRKEVEVLGKKVLVEEAVEQVVGQITSNLKMLPQTQDGRSKFKFKALSGMGRYLGLLKKMETYAQAMDGGAVMGTAHKFLRSEIVQAEARFVKRSGESAAEFQEIVERHYKQGRGLENISDRKDAIHIPAIGDSYTRLEIITVALNTGNEGNLDRLREGRGWKNEQVDAVLANMREKDWLFVQDVWDMIHRRWPEIAKDHRERYGFIPAKVEPKSALRVTAEGKSVEVDGGYFPIAYDSELSAAAQQAEQQNVMKEFGPVRYAKAQTRQGHKKERAASVKGRPLNLNGLFVIQKHLDQVNYDLTMGKTIEDVNKIVRHNRFQEAVTLHMGTGVYQDIDLWLKDVAVGPLYSDSSWLGRKARWLRTAYTGTRLGLRLSTFLVQFTGLTNSVVAVGPGWMRRGAVDFMKLSARDPMGAFKAVREKSVFMETNFSTLNRDVADTIAKLEGKGLIGKINKGFMLPMMGSQYAVNVVTWLGAYNRALYGEKLTDAEAIRYADLAVERSQGSGMASTLSALERGTVGPQTRLSEGWKLWTTLRSYFYTKMNLAIQRTQQTAKNPTPREVTKLAADYLLLFWVEALLAELLLGKLPDFDDDDEPAAEMAMYSADLALSTATAGLPGLDIAYSATKGFDAAPAPARVIDDVADAVTNTSKLFADDDEDINWYAFSRDMVTAGAYGLKGATGLTLPAAQINDYIRGLEKAASGEDASVLDYLRYKKDD